MGSLSANYTATTSQKQFGKNIPLTPLWSCDSFHFVFDRISLAFEPNPATDRRGMFDDPKALTGVNWHDLHVWLQWLWIYLPLVVTFALTVLIAHAIIPSLVTTGHLPATASRLRENALP